MDWAEKYRPARLEDIVGNTSAIRQIAAWAMNWTNKSKPLLIYGKPGIGKTSSAYALANDMRWEVIELNASDQRTAAVIERIAGIGSPTASLTGSVRKLIVLDEADNLQGTADRGGAKAIIECIRKAQQPMILIANDLYGLSRNSGSDANRSCSRQFPPVLSDLDSNISAPQKRLPAAMPLSVQSRRVPRGTSGQRSTCSMPRPSEGIGLKICRCTLPRKMNGYQSSRLSPLFSILRQMTI